MSSKNSFKTAATLETPAGSVTYYALKTLAGQGRVNLERLPFAIRILLENLLRFEDGEIITAEDIEALAAWDTNPAKGREVPYKPARVLMQDFTGVPAVVDLAGMRDAMIRLGGQAEKINPLIPTELVIDHSVQVDEYGADGAFDVNKAREFDRNHERYAFLRWGQKHFGNFNVVPPATGICHQVNLEYLARVVFTQNSGNQCLAYPDTLVGLDSHTTMINALGVMGWGVGGIEAEAVMLGQPYYMLTPDVVGVKLLGHLPPGVTATDLVLTITQKLRQKGVVGKFVEFFGPGLDGLSLADRATVANMAPEYGATMGFFPVDSVTLDYLRLSGRDSDQIGLIEAYCRAQGLFRTSGQADPVYSDTLELDMNTVGPCLAGPKRPQDRLPLAQVKTAFNAGLAESHQRTTPAAVRVKPGKSGSTIPPQGLTLQDGAVVIAAITSCTNTSNPSVMLGAALLAQKAVSRGLKVKPWVKTSLAPGSKVVMDYLKKADLLQYLEALNFHLVAFGCTTCIGNSGPLATEIAEAVSANDLVVASVLSGNRNFEGRISPLTRINYLASPLLVVAYALAGTIDIDLTTEPLTHDPDGAPVFLKDLWPAEAEIRQAVALVAPEMFSRQYAGVFDGDDQWRGLPVPEGSRYAWDETSTYIKAPPFFEDMDSVPRPAEDLSGARVLALLGDSITTDHISPAGAIPAGSPAAAYLTRLGVAPADFNSYGSRRGNHEVMMRGTFGNVRLQNKLVPGVEGGYTVHFPTDRQMSIYEAAMAYQKDATPLIVIAGKEYGTGSSRDWAAKGTRLLGVKAVIAQSYERIHRSNLVGMGVLPLQFRQGESAASLGLDGIETYGISGIAEGLAPGQELLVQARRENGETIEFKVLTRLDSAVEVKYYQHGGILPYVLRGILKS